MKEQTTLSSFKPATEAISGRQSTSEDSPGLGSTTGTENVQFVSASAPGLFSQRLPSLHNSPAALT